MIWQLLHLRQMVALLNEVAKGKHLWCRRSRKSLYSFTDEEDDDDLFGYFTRIIDDGLTDGSHFLTWFIDNSTKNLYNAKVRRVVAMGLAPNGCAPIIRTMRWDRHQTVVHLLTVDALK
ncbi:hypothetical protein CTI12_AA455840 [Artemisia annua]|uniref:Uncharacterized protein n=1 Tax=Artemisia annua TaxID=35608 RepID=A0A2U1LUT0_ARTAN|nr:hypothetical protein CTI12_AA455840 [Artemisia annua]